MSIENKSYNQIENINETSSPNLLGLKAGSKIYFVGIGGYSMCGLAQICHKADYIIAGSDKEISHRTRQLQELGIKVYPSHNSDNIKEFHPDCVVYTVAVPLDNPELITANELSVPVYERSMFLGGINRLFDKIINISGTHGKTTTTTMCSLILEQAGLDPTCHIGAEVKDWGSPVRIGNRHNLFVSEACEYNSSFLQFTSTTAAILNIDHDHVDCFPTIEDVITVFAKFALTVPSSGYLVIPSFDSHIPAMLKILQDEKNLKGEKMPVVITFGREFDFINLSNGDKPDFYISNYKTVNGYPVFDVFYNNEFFTHIELVIPGEHNALNALAAIACAVLNGADANSCAVILNEFMGADNRFSIRGEFKGAKVVADYAHHPSAITVSYLAAKAIAGEHNVWTAFQPITYNRAIGLYDEFVNALFNCPDSFIYEVYTSRETSNFGFSSEMISDAINKSGGKSHFLKTYEELKSNLETLVSKGDVILIMGPDGMKKFADRLANENE